MSEKPREALLRRREVQALVGLKKTALYAAVAKGEFPAPVKIGVRSVAWPESWIADWIAARISASRKTA